MSKTRTTLCESFQKSLNTRACNIGVTSMLKTPCWMMDFFFGFRPSSALKDACLRKPPEKSSFISENFRRGLKAIMRNLNAHSQDYAEQSSMAPVQYTTHIHKTMLNNHRWRLWVGPAGILCDVIAQTHPGSRWRVAFRHTNKGFASTPLGGSCRVCATLSQKPTRGHRGVPRSTI